MQSDSDTFDDVMFQFFQGFGAAAMVWKCTSSKLKDTIPVFGNKELRHLVDFSHLQEASHQREPVAGEIAVLQTINEVARTGTTTHVVGPIPFTRSSKGYTFRVFGLGRGFVGLVLESLSHLPDEGGHSLKHLSPELLAVAFDQVGFGGAFFSLDGWMLGCNQKFNEYMELDVDPALGVHMGRIFAEDDTFWEGSFAKFFASLEGGRRASSEILCRRSNGEDFWGFMSWGMVNNPFTKGPKVVAVSIEDISETKQSSHEVEKYIMELDRMNKELDDFVYVASHDLRSPLTAIFQLSDWLCEDILHTLPEASKEHLEMLHKRVIRMRVLLDDLLLFSRIGRHSYSVEQVDVLHLLHDICNFLSFPSNSVVEIKADVPVLKTHKVPLEIVLRSLIDNTLKHNDKDICRVSIEVRELEAELVFRIADNGPGIPKSFRDQMFGIFRKLDISHEGSGVGLAIVKKTLSLFGGRCELVSQEGEGAEFCVFWPKDTEAVLQSQKLSSTKYKSLTTP